ncbi:hypothetical protein BACPLE_00988 [Phocaeicola plebeius DSM 17135]|uniref:Uncharacterized protein n=1 Tax=Phocaeicola plebeius (strain DSM 17135 / JCM 12973 / CCUG 54634 / M2) TaxID=484018 RepID=B5CW97_PHOPM|nr:hypothetical protein BACPLE_00988 [Phocaeicola plebeius DSM 17135]
MKKASAADKNVLFFMIYNYLVIVTKLGGLRENGWFLCPHSY